jgi:hypothetical protein
VDLVQESKVDVNLVIRTKILHGPDAKAPSSRRAPKSGIERGCRSRWWTLDRDDGG